MDPGHNIGFCRGYRLSNQLRRPWNPYQGPHATPHTYYYESSTCGYVTPCGVPPSFSSPTTRSASVTTNVSKPLSPFKAPTDTVKCSHSDSSGTNRERSSRKLQIQKPANDEQKSRNRHHRRRHQSQQLQTSKMAEERTKNNYSPISRDTLLSDGEIASDNNKQQSSRGSEIARTAGRHCRTATANDGGKERALAFVKRRRLLSVINAITSGDTSKEKVSPREPRASTATPPRKSTSLPTFRDGRHEASMKTGDSGIINGRSARKNTSKHSTRFSVTGNPGIPTTEQQKHTPKSPHHSLKAKAKLNAETCSPDDAFAYAYLDRSFNPSSRTQDTKEAQPYHKKAAATSSEHRSGEAKVSNKEQSMRCSTCSCNTRKQMLEKSTSTDEPFVGDNSYYKGAGNRTSEMASSSANCLDQAASSMSSRKDATVKKWIMESAPYSPTSPTWTLDIDQETVSLTSELVPSAMGSCDMDLSGTEYDACDMDLCNTDKEDSPASSPVSEEKKPCVPYGTEDFKCFKQEPQRCSFSPQVARNRAAENYSIMKHERGCRCGSVLAAVNFELDIYTACSILDLCSDAEGKEEVLRLYTEARELCSKEQHLKRIHQLVRVAIEGKRSSWKNATYVLRKLARIQWSTFPSAEVPGIAVAINDPRMGNSGGQRMACKEASQGKV